MARVAKSLEVLRKQLNEMFPHRSKVSDGGIGDLAHSKRKSDHNPNSAGVVTARDFTFDTNPHDGIGIDCHQLAKVLFESQDKRIKYIIFNSQITVQNGYGLLAGWKDYHGTNPHKHHLHLSVASNPKLYDDPKEWNLKGLASNPAVISNSNPPAEPPPETAHIFHVVKSGDTIWAISRMHKISELELRRLNNIDSKSSVIRIGDKLRVK